MLPDVLESDLRFSSLLDFVTSKDATFVCIYQFVGIGPNASRWFSMGWKRPSLVLLVDSVYHGTVRLVEIVKHRD